MTTQARAMVPTAIEEIVEAHDRELPRAVSVVIPAFNEAAHVAEQIRAVEGVLNGGSWRYEIIVVDDGSTDSTAEQAASTGVRVLRHRRNRGYGAALKRGSEAARYDWILITDADGPYPVSAIPPPRELAPAKHMG